MNEIQKNLTAIEQKFFALKATHQLYAQATPIDQVAEVITYGVVKQQEVLDYLKSSHATSQGEQKEKTNKNWHDMDFQEIILFLYQVIKHRNASKQKQSPCEQKSDSSPKKKKLKISTKEAHQNPFIPEKIFVSIKNSSNIIKNLNQEVPVLKNQNQNIRSTKASDSKSNIKSQPTEQGDLNNLLELSLKQKINSETQCSENWSPKSIFGLPSDFQNLSIKERYSILSKKYGNDKSILQKRFDSIYKNYRKEMYIPFQSFQINNELLMDVRIFLKYYRDFQISIRFKTNDAIKLFKKVASNGLWLDDKKFMEIHYQLVELLDVDEQAFGKQMQNFDPIDIQKADELKKQLSKNIKTLVQNIVKVNELSELVSQDKVKQIFNNNTKSIVKKIVQVHSGLIKEDVMLKLQQRIESRKIKKNYLQGIINGQKSNQDPSGKIHNISTRNSLDKTQRLSPHKLSIYQELQIPKLRTRQLKKSSVYSTLQILNIHKEKEKLKQLVNENENEKYLDAYFKKQKQFYSLARSNSVVITRTPTQNQETNNFSVKSTKLNKHVINRDNLFQRNFSLPRMKFT